MCDDAAPPLSPPLGSAIEAGTRLAGTGTATTRILPLSSKPQAQAQQLSPLATAVLNGGLVRSPPRHRQRHPGSCAVTSRRRDS